MFCVYRWGVISKCIKKGCIDLLKSKKILLITAYGEKYVENVSFIGNTYIKVRLALNGITDVSEVVVDLVEVIRDEPDLIKRKSIEKLREIAKTFLD